MLSLRASPAIRCILPNQKVQLFIFATNLEHVKSTNETNHT